MIVSAKEALSMVVESSPSRTINRTRKWEQLYQDKKVRRSLSIPPTVALSRKDFSKSFETNHLNFESPLAKPCRWEEFSQDSRRRNSLPPSIHCRKASPIQNDDIKRGRIRLPPSLLDPPCTYIVCTD
jgi:hypothetical protein